jgi:hypothetical protein
MMRVAKLKARGLALSGLRLSLIRRVDICYREHTHRGKALFQTRQWRPRKLKKCAFFNSALANAVAMKT